jgi:hypothetical protein
MYMFIWLIFQVYMARSLKVSEFQEILIGFSGMKKNGNKIKFTKKMMEWHLMYMVI